MGREYFMVVQGQNHFRAMSPADKDELIGDVRFDGGYSVVERDGDTIVVVPKKSDVWKKLDSALKVESVPHFITERPLPRDFRYKYFHKILPTGDELFASHEEFHTGSFRVDVASELTCQQAVQRLSLFDLSGAELRIEPKDDSKKGNWLWQSGLNARQIQKALQAADGNVQNFSIGFRNRHFSWRDSDPDRELLSNGLAEAVDKAHGANKPRIAFTSEEFNEADFFAVLKTFATKAANRHAAEIRDFLNEIELPEGSLLPMASSGLEISLAR